MKFLNRIISTILIITLLISNVSTSVLAFDSSDTGNISISGGEATSSNSKSDSASTSDLLGNYTWTTDIDGTKKVYSTTLADGVYFNGQDENYLYMMYVNKKTADAKTFYRTVGYTVLLAENEKQKASQ